MSKLDEGNKVLRAVFDTNVLIDSVSDPLNAASQLLEAAVEGRLKAIATPAVEREYHKIMRRLVEQDADREMVDSFLVNLEMVTPTRVDVQLDDEEDYKILQAAAGGQADLIITNDHHLLDVGEYNETRIVRAPEALTIFQEEGGGGGEWGQWVKGLGIGCALLSLWLQPTAWAQTPNADVSAKEQEIAELDRKIKELTAEHADASSDVAETQAEVNRLSRQLEAARLELRRTQLTINKVTEEQASTSDQIETLTVDIAEQREQLRGLVRVLYEEEQQSLIRLFFDSFSLSEVLAQRAILEGLQQQVTEVAQEMRQKVDELTAHEKTLQEREENLTQLQAVLAAQQNEVATQEATEREVLAGQKVEAATAAAALAEAKAAREEIAQQVFNLKGSNIQLSLNSATDMAKHASSLTGVRPALIMAVIKVESNLGNNVGGGRYPDDMQPQSREAFVRITDKLKLDRANTPVSRKPANGSGWGGAMGPAQIMPATWEGMEARLEALMKKSPVNPYELSDAFVATAVFLADRGAAAGKDREALAKYVAGPYWEYHLNGWYVERVLAVTAEYEKEFSK